MIQGIESSRKDTVNNAVLARDQIWDLVARSCMHLDREEYGDYLSLFDAQGRYAITTYSPDMRKDMVYLSLDKEELTTLLDNIHNHVHLSGTLFRQVALYSLEEKSGDYQAMSYVTVTHTNLDGVSSVFCVARYYDEIGIGPQGAILKARTVRMETRDIGAGCHYPI